MEVHGVVVSNSRETKKCPFCAEEILFEAKKCKHCGELLMAAQSAENIPAVATIVSVAPSVFPSTVTSVSRKLFPFATRRIRGKLELAGKSTWLSNNRGSWAYSRYSILQIDGKKLRDVYVRDHLGSYLDVSIGEEVEVLIVHSMLKWYLIAIRTPSGVEKSGIIPAFAMVLSFLGFPIYGIGIPLFINNLARLLAVMRF